MLGSTTPLPVERLAERYASREDYADRYAAATDRTSAEGFVLEADRATLLEYAEPSRIAG